MLVSLNNSKTTTIRYFPPKEHELNKLASPYFICPTIDAVIYWLQHFPFDILTTVEIWVVIYERYNVNEMGGYANILKHQCTLTWAFKFEKILARVEILDKLGECY